MSYAFQKGDNPQNGLDYSFESLPEDGTIMHGRCVCTGLTQDPITRRVKYPQVTS